MMTKRMKQENSIGHSLEAYYRFHSTFYDLTRWAFLFGRRSLIQKLPDLPPDARIMETGCGTGSNLKHLGSAYPNAHIHGIDLSPDMLSKAEHKLSDDDQITLTNAEYGQDSLETGPFDLILLSYSLSLTGSRIDNIIRNVHDDLISGGYVAVVDFHQTPFRSFRRWMKFNNVTMDGATPTLLNKLFTHRYQNTGKAYGGLWTYFQFIGQRVDR